MLGTEAFRGGKKKKNQLPRAVAGKVLHRMLWKVSFKSCLEVQSGLGSPLPVPGVRCRYLVETVTSSGTGEPVPLRFHA